MRELRLERARDSRVAEGGIRSAHSTPRIASPEVEPPLRRNPSRPVVGDKILRFLVRAELSPRALAFFTEFIKIISDSGSNVVLSPEGALSVCHPGSKGGETVEIGRFDNDFSSLGRIAIDSRALLIGQKTQQEFSELALAIILEKSRIPLCIRSAFIGDADAAALKEADGFILTFSRKLALLEAKFLRKELLVLYINAEGMRRMEGKNWLMLLWEEIKA